MPSETPDGVEGFWASASLTALEAVRPSRVRIRLIRLAMGATLPPGVRGGSQATRRSSPGVVRGPPVMLPITAGAVRRAREAQGRGDPADSVSCVSREMEPFGWIATSSSLIHHGPPLPMTLFSVKPAGSQGRRTIEVGCTKVVMHPTSVVLLSALLTRCCVLSGLLHGCCDLLRGVVCGGRDGR